MKTIGDAILQKTTVISTFLSFISSEGQLFDICTDGLLTFLQSVCGLNEEPGETYTQKGRTCQLWSNCMSFKFYVPFQCLKSLTHFRI